MTAMKEDRRIRRTRNMLLEALMDLIIEKGYDAITIQDIIDRANVGRTTFYSHFQDKEQLLLGSIDQLREFLKEQCSMHSLSTESGGHRFSFSLAMLQHVQGNRLIFRAVVGKQSGVLVLYHIKRMLTEIAREEISALLPSSTSSKIPQDVAIEFVVNTFWSILAWWMEQNNPYSAVEMDQMFHTLALSGISAL
ncbi:TetR/AcrR family transcriptional regulator [Paenibacillus sp. NEAU-GSW1]|uniref:TetR/AcrR family transcriptional regulator n=1 Tax=Paenibacillus sp. NEAU-GSW1 TaxID=2682486 RepID=UPI0012E10067|nr:TetR/AcrR family transcriptional regulator [Paenibacillus sp. NEAU-GSW1]MUT67427.1 TetR family transcriptional regulator [Paenibacillus sp. NEAU-GSW1]